MLSIEKIALNYLLKIILETTTIIILICSVCLTATLIVGNYTSLVITISCIITVFMILSYINVILDKKIMKQMLAEKSNEILKEELE